MKRRKFFQWLGLGAVVAVVPKVVESMPTEEVVPIIDPLSSKWRRSGITPRFDHLNPGATLCKLFGSKEQQGESSYKVRINRKLNLGDDVLFKSSDSFHTDQFIPGRSLFRVIEVRGTPYTYIIAPYNINDKLVEDKVYAVIIFPNTQCTASFKPTGVIFTDKML